MILSRLEKRTRVRSLIVVSPDRVPPLPAIGRKLSFSIENSISLMHSGEVSITEWQCWSFYRANSGVILPSSIHRKSFPVIIDEPGKGEGISDDTERPCNKESSEYLSWEIYSSQHHERVLPGTCEHDNAPSPRINNRKSAETFPQIIPFGDLREGNLTDSEYCFHVLVND